jgi:hypothetical protein
MAALQLSENDNPRSEDTANYVALRTRFFDDVAQVTAHWAFDKLSCLLPEWMQRCDRLVLAERHHAV